MKRLFAIALLFAGLAAQAQETPTVTARVEPDSIMIGDRFDYVIAVSMRLCLSVASISPLRRCHEAA